MKGVVLYGPPASGKDTVTRELRKLSSEYVHYSRLKVGGGRTAGYRMTTQAAVDSLRINGDVIWENNRYDALYVVDRPSLHSALSAGIPIIHLGQPEAVKAVTLSIADANWVIVYLWCPREVARTRIIDRNTGDEETRLRAWDETVQISGAHLTIDTALVSPEESARRIDGCLRNHSRRW